jgi:glycosyltransferase involved in cell wall biosynthesis
MALGRAVVSTPIGCEGLDVEHGRHLLIAGNPEDFARSVLDLLQDRALRERMAASARRLVEERYDWRVIGARLRALYSEMAGDQIPS